jgi:hypothetical protein
MKDVIIATGPWVGGNMTTPHRLVLVSRHNPVGITGERIVYDPTPVEFCVYFQKDTGELHTGSYYPVNREAWRAQLAVDILPKFHERVANYSFSNAGNIRLYDPWGETRDEE